MLETALHNVDIDITEDCWVTAAALCYGTHALEAAAYCCSVNLRTTIETVKPAMIIPVGIDAVRAVMSHLWREGAGDMSRFFGERIPVAKWGAWVCPVYDANYILSLGRTSAGLPQGLGETAYLWLTRHIEAMAEKLNQPVVAETPNVDLVFNVDEIVYWLNTVSGLSKGYVAFDYECNCLRPETTGAKVLCASLCVGGWDKCKKVLSFPMLNSVIPAWRAFLASNVAKIGWNVKFEQNFSRVLFGQPVNNFVSDGMLNAHLLDCRKGVTSLKYQAFAKLGVGGYEDSVSGYIDSSKDGKLNRLHELPKEILLKYCGLDSYLTWKLVMMQMREFEMSPYWKAN
jgi:hypothetical protein